LIGRLDEWGYALQRLLEPRLAAGSPTALAVAFAAGVLTSFTPCVYPMIPVTVTYIGGAAGGDRRRAAWLSLVYVSGLALVYAGLGVASALLGAQFGSFTRSFWVYGAVGLLLGVAAGFVAAPCTAPVLGLLLVYVARTRNVLWGGTLLLMFAIGLGLLLMLLGIFSGMLANLPRAGAWMQRIKIAFGVGMLLVAAYFLYQAVELLRHPAQVA
jgi:thiol:disulfide interchange protein DsbD